MQETIFIFKIYKTEITKMCILHINHGKVLIAEADWQITAQIQWKEKYGAGAPSQKGRSHS